MVLTMPGGWGWISNTILQLWSSGAFYLLMLLNGFGYLLLTREQVQQEIERLAVVDTLTDCPNRRGFFIALAPWLSLARRPGLPTSLVLFDLDHFKRINDSYGHPAGDTVLRAVVEVCKKQLRDSDQLGRMAGVEFAILLPRTALPEAALVAERMRAAVEATPAKGERAMIGMTASFGVTTIRADDTTVSLFKRADEALRAAKAAGRNRVVEAAPANTA
jgi:diguanylate cyclase (GGDEF)-like protein